MTDLRTRRGRHALDLATVLVARDLRGRYGGTVFGLLWAPAGTVVRTIVLSFLFVRVVPLDVDAYPTFLITALAAWQLLTQTIAGGTDVFTSNRDLVRRPGFPTAVLPVVAAGTAFGAYLLTLPAVLVVLVATGRLAPSAVAVVPVTAVALLIALGPAYALGTLHVRFRDVKPLSELGLWLLFFLTPVIYEAGRVPDRYQWLTSLNPLAIPVRLHRQVLYDGDWPDPGLLLAGLGVGTVGLLAGLWVFQRAHHRLADEL